MITAFWIKSPFRHAPLGFGVTAHSLDDALAILRAMGYERYLPENIAEMDVRANVTIDQLQRDDPFVIVHMGPINVRGIWYPFSAVGVPRWADEQI